MTPDVLKGRVSPSGAFLEGSQTPLAELAGNYFELAPGNPQAAIGAASQPGIGGATTLWYGVDNPPTYNPHELLPQVAPSQVAPLTEGLWVLEADLCAGFSTAYPGANNAGGLQTAIRLVGDVDIVKANPKPPQALGFIAAGTTSTQRLAQYFAISSADIEANGGKPFSAFVISLSRETAPIVAGSGVYDSGSNTLNFFNGTRFLFRKLR